MPDRKFTAFVPFAALHDALERRRPFLGKNDRRAGLN
jgi:hypothetical protein